MADGSDIYTRLVALEASSHRQSRWHFIWSPTPWIIRAFTGEAGSARDLAMQAWCVDQYGAPPRYEGDDVAQWQRAPATIKRRAHFGFASEAQMLAFAAAWPNPPDRPEDPEDDPEDTPEHERLPPPLPPEE